MNVKVNYCALCSVRVPVRVWSLFSVWLANDYAHMSILFSVVIVTFPAALRGSSRRHRNFAFYLHVVSGSLSNGSQRKVSTHTCGHLPAEH